MKKEIQEIEDLANVIRHANDQDCECKCEACFNCTAGNMANAVYKAGYRKADGLIAENERLLAEIKEIEKVRDAERDTACEKIALGICKACDCYCGDDGCLEGNEYGDCQYANDIAYSVYDELYGEEDNDD